MPKIILLARRILRKTESHHFIDGLLCKERIVAKFSKKYFKGERLTRKLSISWAQVAKVGGEFLFGASWKAQSDIWHSALYTALHRTAPVTRSPWLLPTKGTSGARVKRLSTSGSSNSSDAYCCPHLQSVPACDTLAITHYTNLHGA